MSEHEHAEHDEHHEELSFWRKYVFSVDHKVIGIQYTITGLVFLFFGFCLMMLMRWQLAYPGKALPIIGALFGEDRMPGGVMLPEFYNQLGAMHGTIMVFMGVVPLAVGGFGNFVLPLQIGAPDMAFPRLNMLSYWSYFVGGADLERQHEVAEAADGQRHDAHEDHDRAVHRPELVVELGQHDAAGRVGLAHQAADDRNRPTGEGELPAHDQHQAEAEQEEHQRG